MSCLRQAVIDTSKRALRTACAVLKASAARVRVGEFGGKGGFNTVEVQGSEHQREVYTHEDQSAD